VLDELPAFTRGAVQPAFAGADQEARVELAEVVEVVGDAASDVGRGVVFEAFEQGEDPLGVVLEPGHPSRPGQAQTRSFGDEAAHVRAWVGGPFLEYRDCPVRVAVEVGADADLGAEPLGQLALRCHGELEVVEAVFGDEDPVRQVSEWGHPDARDVVAFEFGSQRGEHDLHCARVIAGEVFGERGRDVAAALEEPEPCEALRCLCDERLLREARMRRRQIVGKAAHERDREEGF
jgi:hypothetical protein